RRSILIRTRRRSLPSTGCGASSPTRCTPRPPRCEECDSSHEATGRRRKGSIMIVRPMIGEWSPPAIERIRAVEARRLAVLAVPGLSGDLHQDLGRTAMGLEIVGSLNTDDERDEFLKIIREKFLAGDPVAFVADIVKESKLEQVLIEALD